jgi:hypothetical protein
MILLTLPCFRAASERTTGGADVRSLSNQFALNVFAVMLAAEINSIFFCSRSPHVSFSHEAEEVMHLVFRLHSKRIECVTLDIYCTPFSHKCRVRVFAECFSFYIYSRAELLREFYLAHTRSLG